MNTKWPDEVGEGYQKMHINASARSTLLRFCFCPVLKGGKKTPYNNPGLLLSDFFLVSPEIVTSNVQDKKD